MKNFTFLFLLIFGLINIGYSKSYTSTDSILINQVKASNDICRQLRKINKTISKITEIGSNQDSILISNFQNLNNDITDIDGDFDKIINKINSPGSSNKEEELGLLERAFPHIIGAFIGAGFVLLVFYLGIRRERIKEKEKLEKENKEKTHYLASLLKSTINLAKKNLAGINEFCEEIESTPLLIPHIPFHAPQDINRLSDLIGNPEYYHAFLNEFKDDDEKVEKFRRVAGGVDYLKSQFDQIFDMQKIKQMKHMERLKEYNRTIIKAREQILEIGQHHHQTQPNFSNSILTAFRNFHDNLEDRSDLKYLEENFIAPLKKIFIDNSSVIPKSNYFISLLNSASSIYEDIPLQNIAHSNDFKGFFEPINLSIDTLEKEGKKLLVKVGDK